MDEKAVNHEAREIYHHIMSIIDDIYDHKSQMIAISLWIDANFERKKT